MELRRPAELHRDGRATLVAMIAMKLIAVALLALAVL
jgi:hypothetical protein